jgi:hypothetical protein
MSAAGTLTQQSLAKDLWPRTIEELRAFVGLAEKQEVDLSAKINDLFKQVTQVTDGLVLSALEKRTASEFTASATTSFNDYVRILRAKSDLLQVVLRNDSEATERIVNRSLSELEADFRDHGAQKFGAPVSDQAIFTIWTLRKTANEIWKLFRPEVLSRPLPENSRPEAEKLYSQFALYSAWAQFHLECLTTSMRLKQTLYPDVLPAIISGLRSEVNAYAIAKQMVDLYLPPAVEPEMAPYAWDSEDEDLLASSMEDIEQEELEEY